MSSRYFPNKNQPLFKDKHGWWFIDETWSEAIGPYNSATKARLALNQYAIDLQERGYSE